MPDEVADLIYLDPPFNSARSYNLHFKQRKGQRKKSNKWEGKGGKELNAYSL